MQYDVISSHQDWCSSTSSIPFDSRVQARTNNEGTVNDDHHFVDLDQVIAERNKNSGLASTAARRRSEERSTANEEVDDLRMLGAVANRSSPARRHSRGRHGAQQATFDSGQRARRGAWGAPAPGAAQAAAQPVMAGSPPSHRPAHHRLRDFAPYTPSFEEVPPPSYSAPPPGAVYLSTVKLAGHLLASSILPPPLVQPVSINELKKTSRTGRLPTVRDCFEMASPPMPHLFENGRRRVPPPPSLVTAAAREPDATPITFDTDGSGDVGGPQQSAPPHWHHIHHHHNDRFFHAASRAAASGIAAMVFSARHHHPPMPLAGSFHLHHHHGRQPPHATVQSHPAAMAELPDVGIVAPYATPPGWRTPVAQPVVAHRPPSFSTQQPYMFPHVEHCTHNPYNTLDPQQRVIKPVGMSDDNIAFAVIKYDVSFLNSTVESNANVNRVQHQPRPVPFQQQRVVSSDAISVADATPSGGPFTHQDASVTHTHEVRVGSEDGEASARGPRAGPVTADATEGNRNVESAPDAEHKSHTSQMRHERAVDEAASAPPVGDSLADAAALPHLILRHVLVACSEFQIAAFLFSATGEHVHGFSRIETAPAFLQDDLASDWAVWLVRGRDAAHHIRRVCDESAWLGPHFALLATNHASRAYLRAQLPQMGGRFVGDGWGDEADIRAFGTAPLSIRCLYE